MNPAPTPITEAAGLLASGVIFPRRVGLRRVGAPAEAPADVLAGFKRGGVSLYFGDDPILHVDLDGRWQRAFVAGMHYLKGLDATTRAVDRVREGGAMVLRRRTLAPAEADALDAAIAGRARELADALDAGALDPMAPPAPSRPVDPAELSTFLRVMAGRDAATWADQRARYRAAYGDGPPPFLPPDCPNPVVFRPGPATSAAEFAGHARAVVALLGRRVEQSREAFLAGPDWSRLPADAILDLLGVIASALPIRPDRSRPRALDAPAEADGPRIESIHGWVDDPAAFAPAAADGPRLHAAHFGRVTFRVDARPDLPAGAIRDTVGPLKAAGIGIGLACFLKQDGDAAQSALAGLAATLPLGRGDLITLVEAGPAGEVDAWKSCLAAALPGGGAKVVAYLPEKQWS